MIIPRVLNSWSISCTNWSSDTILQTFCSYFSNLAQVIILSSDQRSHELEKKSNVQIAKQVSCLAREFFHRPRLVKKILNHSLSNLKLFFICLVVLQHSYQKRFHRTVTNNQVLKLTFPRSNNNVGLSSFYHFIARN